MSNLMAVLLNGVAQLEYYRDRPLPDHQALHLDKMDQRMDQGIQVGEESVSKPESISIIINLYDPDRQAHHIR